MGFWDRLLGNDDTSAPSAPRTPPYGQPAPTVRTSTDRTSTDRTPPRSEDEIAIERYRYLLRTAPPETIEQVHAEAFEKLTEPQRRQVLADLSSGLATAERPDSTDPRVMARAATRAEAMNPGFMERTLGAGTYGGRQGPGFGSMVGSSILGTVAGYVIGSALVSSFMAPAFASDQGNDDGSSDAGGDAGSGDPGSGDAGSADAAPADAGGDSGWGGDDFGSDVGGGDFGGGDFGGFDGF